MTDTPLSLRVYRGFRNRVPTQKGKPLQSTYITTLENELILPFFQAEGEHGRLYVSESTPTAPFLGTYSDRQFQPEETITLTPVKDFDLQQKRISNIERKNYEQKDYRLHLHHSSEIPAKEVYELFAQTQDNHVGNYAKYWKDENSLDKFLENMKLFRQRSNNHKELNYRLLKPVE